jgi:hypothetical protein
MAAPGCARPVRGGDALIGLGVVMLMQPFSCCSTAIPLSRSWPGRWDFVIVSHFRTSAMARSGSKTSPRAFGTFTAVKGVRPDRRSRRVLRHARPSGCGKTTTLRMIAGPRTADRRPHLLDGEDVTLCRASARDIAFVFQMFALYPHMNVRQNIGFPAELPELPRAEIRGASRRLRSCCGLIICWSGGSAGFPAVIGSALRSAAPSCGGPRRS